MLLVYRSDPTGGQQFFGRASDPTDTHTPLGTVTPLIAGLYHEGVRVPEEPMTDPVVEKLRPKLDPFYRAVESVLIGQRHLIDGLLIGLLTDGHVLLEGVPGLAKTLAVRTVARAPAPEVPAHPVHA